MIRRMPHAALQGLIDHMGRSWLLFDIDPTHMTTLEHADSNESTRPPVARPRKKVAAPGYPGRKRADAIRSRMTVLVSSAMMWALTFAQPGNGQRSPALERACETIAHLRSRLLVRPAEQGAGDDGATLPGDGLTVSRASLMRECVVRADGEFGLLPYVAIIQRHGLHYLIRCRDYKAIFALPAVQEALRPGSTCQTHSADSPMTRQLFDIPDVVWGEVEGCVVRPRVVVTRSPLPPGQTKPAVGHLHKGFVYEVFVTDLPPSALHAADVVALYLNRGLLEKTLADEDREMRTDRWMTNCGPGQDLFQVLCQWVWNQRLALGVKMIHAPLPRVTRFDVPLTPCAPEPLDSLPDGRPAETPAAPHAPAASETVASAQAEATATDAPAMPTPPSTASFGPSAFKRDAPGKVTCPAGQPMRRVEVRMRSGGPRERFEAPRKACQVCPSASKCRQTSASTSKGRIVDLPMTSTDSANYLGARAATGSPQTRRAQLPLESPSPAPAVLPARRLPLLQQPHLYWADLPASEARHSLHETLAREHVEIRPSAQPPARRPAPRILERDQRAHRRRTWDERLARNARPHDAPPIRIHVSGVPPKLARAVGLPSSASQPHDIVLGSQGADATT